MGAERCRPLGGAAEGEASLDRDRLRLGARRRGLVGGQVVGRQGAGEFLVAEALKVAGRREVPHPPLAPGERGVGDLAGKRLDESVLAPLGAARVDLDLEELPADEPAKTVFEVRHLSAGDGGEGSKGKGLAEHRGVGDEVPVGGVEGIQAARDEGAQGLGDAEGAEVTDRLVSVFGSLQAAIREQHANGLDGVEGDAVRAVDDRPHRALGESRHEPGDELAHRRLRQRFQGEAAEVAGVAAPVRAAVEEFRPSQGHHEDWHAFRPPEQMVDEVEQSRVGPLEVLEDEDRGGLQRNPLEEDPPGGEEDLATTGRRRLQAQQRQERRFDPASIVLAGNELGDRCRDPGPRRGLVVALGQAGPPADHLAKGPERDSLAVGGGPAVVPVGWFDETVEVLLKLPRKTALADAPGPGDRDQTRPPVASGGCQEVLQEAQLPVAADEGGLGQVGATLAAALGHDPQGPPGRNRRSLALERLHAGRLEGNRGGRRPIRRLADEHGARRRNRLEPGGGVDDVAHDHPLADRPDRHRRFARQDPGPGSHAQGRHGVDELEAGPDSSFGVVLAGDWRPPHRHDRVADELLDRPAVALDRIAGDLEIAIEGLADFLGVVCLGIRREPDHVGKEDRHETPLDGSLRRRRGRKRNGDGNASRVCGVGDERRRTLPAELRVGAVRRATCRTEQGQWSRAFLAELAFRFILGRADRADHDDPV